MDTTTPAGGGVYAITNVLNGKQYIGSTDSFRRRWSEHRITLAGNRHHNSHLQHAYNKYGSEVFRYDVLEYVKDLDILHDRERWWFAARLASHRTWEYNIKQDATGTRGVIVSPETRRRLANAMRGRKASPALRMKLSEAHKGKPLTEKARAAYDCRKGIPVRPLTPENKEKLRLAHLARRGAPLTPTQEAFYARRRGRVWTEEERNAHKMYFEGELSVKHQAATNRLHESRSLRFLEMGRANRGKTESEEHRRAIGEGARRALANDPTLLARRAEGIKRAHAARSPERQAEIGAKIGAKSKGRVMSPESRAKMSASHKGIPATATQRAALDRGREKTNRMGWNRGKHRPINPAHYEQPPLFDGETHSGS